MFQRIKKTLMERKMQNSKRVILWNLEDLLKWVVEFFLGSKPGWEVISVSEKRGVDNFIQKVNQENPDVVIFCKDDSEEDSEMLMQLLRNCPDVKFVTIHRDNNSIEVFRKQKIWLKEASDLASIVDS
jgi:DNA-binding NarL/FixJ family response regulator